MTTTILDRVRAHVHRAPPRRPTRLRLVSSSPVCTVTPITRPPATHVAVQTRADEPAAVVPAGRTPERDAAMRLVIAPPPTLAERILLVAARLPQPFTRADLVVAAFQRWPETFALDGYPHLPSSNNVDPVVVKLVQRGLLDRVNGALVVTRRGGQRAARLDP